MTTVVVVILLVLIAFVVGVLAMHGDLACNATPPMRSDAGARPDAPIDPADDHQLTLLLGMTGGAVTDAAVARAALERFEADHGRRATTRDLGAVVGLMRTMHRPTA